MLELTWSFEVEALGFWARLMLKALGRSFVPQKANKPSLFVGCPPAVMWVKLAEQHK